jgi:crotonobetainyl-CoA:carnitine CoA-transferase CaiB-like acyl-CoA transferase
MLAYGVLAALLARDRFGVGQEVDASHLGSMIWLQGLSVAARCMMGFAIPRMPRKYAANPLWNHYQCGDGKWICLGMLQPDRYWADFVRVLGRPDLADDERFANLRARAANSAAAVEILDAVFATKGRDEWLAILRAGGDFIFTIVNSVDELPGDLQVQANQYITDFDHPQFGTTQVVGLPLRLKQTPGSIRLPAPEFGQHTEEILTGLLGYSWEDIGALKEKLVI